MKNPSVFVGITILSIPIRIWDLPKGSLFSLTESGKNLAGDYQIYCKISQTKCVLLSHPDKPEYRIPQLVASDTGYKVLENWGLIEIGNSIKENG